MLDARLLQKAIAGDDQAIVAILQHYKGSLYRVAYSYMRSEQDALEALQELSYRCFRSIHRLKEPGYIGTWLTKILINICRDMLRKRKRELVADYNIEGSYEMSYDVEWLELLDGLDEAQRELMYMKYVEDQSNAVIAKQLSIPEGTVKSRLYYTLRKLRHLFGEE